MNGRGELGALGERLAKAHLLQLGYKVLEQNVRMRGGEIDLVAKDGDTVVIVEVRTKSTLRFGTPEESITPSKLARLGRLGQFYVQARKLEEVAWRIDVVAVEMESNGKLRRIEVLKNVGG